MKNKMENTTENETKGYECLNCGREINDVATCLQDKKYYKTSTGAFPAVFCKDECASHYTEENGTPVMSFETRKIRELDEIFRSEAKNEKQFSDRSVGLENNLV